MFGYWKREAIRQHFVIVGLEEELQVMSDRSDTQAGAIKAIQKRAGAYASELEELEQIREDEVNELKAQRCELNATILRLQKERDQVRGALFEGHTFMKSVMMEVEIAAQKYGHFNSLHEAYSVLLEEVEEFWDEVKKKQENRDLEAVRSELIQIAAMAVKANDFIMEQE
ncbi:MAG: hypothetical protein DRQ40_09140 [Gammaproteobacteria bacterium]|nr:MAG: hypothetical protein DRQ40_09140 [Gammaproteobacteria bacterium]